jgi:hypothetical protein
MQLLGLVVLSVCEGGMDMMEDDSGRENEGVKDIIEIAGELAKRKKHKRRIPLAAGLGRLSCAKEAQDRSTGFRMIGILKS